MRITIILLALILGACSKSTFTEVSPESTCTPTRVENGVEFKCEDGSTYLIKDGLDGQDGEDGTDSFIVDSYDPCGPSNSGHDEILLLTKDGQYLAYFAVNGDAKKARLTLLEENTLYQTTDVQQCKFSIINEEVVEL